MSRFYLKMTEENLSPMKVLYMRRMGTYGAENYALMARFKQWLRENQLYCDDTIVLGIPLDDPRTTESSQCRYDVCMIHSAVIGNEVQSRTVEGGKYLVFLIEHTPEAMQRAWSECFGALASERYQFDPSRPVMERYAKALVDRHRCELCVPIL